ncbi:MAG TPA: three-Cys-motif partner protein TcmP [Candidatus Limnocylindrales bacterium]
MKHKILRRYGMAFTHKLSQGSAPPVVLVDGYAGTGRYPDGTPASAELLIRAAVSAKPSTTYVELVEKEGPYCRQLAELVKEYERGSGRIGWAIVSQGKVEQYLPEILRRAAGKHLFLFLDPCGAGLSFRQVVELHRRTPRGWPRTEVLLNFNGDLGRRVAANAINAERDSVLDDICGGGWWRDAVKKGRLESPDDWEIALQLLVDGYVARLEKAMPGYMVTAVPVKKRYTNQPVFYLIHTTMSGFGLWEISDAIARATREWREEHDLRETGGQASLFAPPDEVVSIGEGKIRVRSNLLGLVGQRSFRLADCSRQVLDGALGVVTGSEVGEIARKMEKAKEIRLQRDKKPERYVVHPM